MKDNDLLHLYKNDIGVLAVSSYLKQGNKNISIKGLSGDLNIITALAVTKNDQENHCFVLEDKKSALIFYSSLSRLLKKEKIFFFPYSYRKAYDDEFINNANVVFRTEAIEAITNKSKEKIYLISYPEGVFEKTTNIQTKNKLSLLIKKGETLEYSFLVNYLEEQNFESVDFVKEPGQYSVRGNIIDVFSFTNKEPIRVEYEENKIVRIKLFNVVSQLTVEEKTKVKILANTEKNQTQSSFVSLFSILNEKWVFWFENLSLSANIIEENSKKHH